MEIKILGPGCARCHELEKRVRRAVDELGMAAEIQKVSDLRAIAAAGIMSTPGLVIDGRVKASGRIPSLEDIKNWILAART
jgi:small redox-active disulfide protein 2